MTAQNPTVPTADAPRWPALIPIVIIAVPVALKLAGLGIATRGSSSVCCSA